MTDFLWHRVSEEEKEDIRKQASKILDDFSEKLSGIDKKVEDSLIERVESERVESQGKCDDNFSREIIFSNASEKNNDFIIAEKKKW
jgi:Asp-tRNA(Asn)/Glu-tRNA(Gln) amidotransferase C subunit